MNKIKQLFESALKESFFSAVLKVASGTALAQLIGILIIPIITRLYSPEEFKVFAFYAAVIALLGPISNLRYNIAIVVPKNSERANDLVRLAIYVLFVFVAVITLLTFLFNSFEISYFEQYDEMMGISYLIPLGVLFSGLLLVFHNYYVRQQKFGLLAKISVFQALISAMMQIAFYKLKGIGLIIGHMALSSGAFILLYYWYNDNKRAVNNQQNSVIAVMLRYKDYPKFSTFEVFFNSAGIQIPIILISFFVIGPEMSYLFLAMKIFQAPIALIGGSVSQVYLSYSVDKKRTNELRGFTAETLQKLLKIGFIPIIFLAFASPLVIPIVLGEQWGEVGYYILIMLPWFLLQFLASPISMVMHVLGLQRRLMLLTAFGGLLRILSVVIPYLVIGAEYVTEFYIVSGAIFYIICLWVFSSSAGLKRQDCVQIIVNSYKVILVGVAIASLLFFVNFYIRA